MEKHGKLRIETHLGEIRCELAQVDKVLEDAVATLFGAFTNINDLVRLHQRISTQLGLIHQAAECTHRGQHPPGWIADSADPALARRDMSMALLFAQQAGLGDQIENQVNAVVQSLQFQDIASQALARALNRLSLLESLIGMPGAVARARKPRHDAESAKSKPGPRHAVADIIDFPRARAAASNGLKAGDAELF